MMTRNFLHIHRRMLLFPVVVMFLSCGLQIPGENVPDKDVDTGDNSADGTPTGNCAEIKAKPDCPNLGICEEAEIPYLCDETGEQPEWVCDYSGISGYQAEDDKCDGEDSDCDGVADEAEKGAADVCPEEADKGVCKKIVVKCTDGDYECDFAALVDDSGAPLFVEKEHFEMGNPGLWCDGEDNDCDDDTDEQHDTAQGWSPEDLDYFPWEDCRPLQGACAVSVYEDGETWLTDSEFIISCRNGSMQCAYECPAEGDIAGECDYEDKLAAIGFEKEESRCDGVDNDCDGITDEVFDVEQSTCQYQGVCAGQVEAICKNLADNPEDDIEPGWVCIYDNALLLDPTFEFQDLAACQGEPGCGAETRCDGLDNDCDGLTDEGLVWPAKCFQQDLAGAVVIDCEDEDCAAFHPDCDGAEPKTFDDCPALEKVEIAGIKNIWVPQLDPGTGMPLLYGVCSYIQGQTPVHLSCAPLDVDEDEVADTAIWTCEYGDVERFNGTEGDDDVVWCDGRDNNCDGVVDGELKPSGAVVYISSDKVASEVPCRHVGACDGNWEAVCNDGGESPGQWKCSYDGADIEMTDPNNPDCDPGYANCIWTETLCDGIDNDCDGLEDELLDGLKNNLQQVCAGKIGVGVCSEDALNTVCANTGEDDNVVKEFVCSYDSISAYASKEQGNKNLCDGLDNDCDGETDESISIVSPAEHQLYTTGCLYLGVCAVSSFATCTPPLVPDPGVSHWECDYSKVPNFYGYHATINDQLIEVECDGKDNDCDGLIDEDLQQNLGWAPDGLNPKDKSGCSFKGICGSEGNMIWSCVMVEGQAMWDCDASAAGALFQDPEAMCDGIDNDCDGFIDEELHDPGPFPGAECETKGVCGSEALQAECITSDQGQAQYICNYDLLPNYDEGIENSCDGLDNDCDGLTDEDLDWKLSADCASLGVCDSPQLNATCEGIDGWNCLFGLIDDYEAEEVTCDQTDNDCDGATDELTCDDCEPCVTDDYCINGKCVEPPAPQKEAGVSNLCAYLGNYCMYINPHSGECDFVDFGLKACGTPDQWFLCSAGVWFGDDASICSGNKPVCFDGNCVHCLPFSKKCLGNNIYQCKADGSEYTYNGSCTGSNICLGQGQCVNNDEFVVSTHSLADTPTDINPKVAPRLTGGFGVVYESRKFSGGDESDILLRVFDGTMEAEGVVEVIVNSEVEGGQTNPDIAAITGGQGGFIVVWEDTNAPGELIDGIEIMAQSFSDDGEKIGEAFLVNTELEGNQELPSVAALPNGIFLIAWEDDAGNDAPNVSAQAYSPDRTKFGPQFIMNSYLPGNQNYPALANRGTQGFVSTWTSQNQKESYDIFGQLYDKNVSPALAEFEVNIYFPSVQQKQAVAGFTGAQAGQFVTVWETFGQDAGSLGVFMNIFGSDGVKLLQAEVGVNTQVQVGSQRDVAVAATEDNHIVVVWETQALGDDTDGEGVAAKVFTNEGTPMTPSEFLVNQTTDGKQFNPDVTQIAGLGYVVAWFEQVDGNYNIYARAFKVD